MKALGLALGLVVSAFAANAAGAQDLPLAQRLADAVEAKNTAALSEIARNSPVMLVGNDSRPMTADEMYGLVEGCSLVEVSPDPTELWLGSAGWLCTDRPREELPCFDQAYRIYILRPTENPTLAVSRADHHRVDRCGTPTLRDPPPPPRPMPRSEANQ